MFFWKLLLLFLYIYFTKWFFWFFRSSTTKRVCTQETHKGKLTKKKKYNKTAVCSQSQRSRRRRRWRFSVVTFSYTFSGLCLCVCLSVYAYMYMCARVRVQRKMYETKREYVAQSKCSDNSTTQHCVKRRRRRQQQLSAADRQSQTCGSVCVLRLYAWECAQQKQQQKKFRLWKIIHIHICTYVVCVCVRHGWRQIQCESEWEQQFA